jgi:hypothetical protein
MARNEREFGLYRPVAVPGMNIGVAHATGLSLDQNLPWARRRNVQFLKH